eukprot:g7299.t1
MYPWKTTGFSLPKPCDGFFHWGKVDLAFHKGDRRKTLQENIAKKFDVKEFAGLKKELDPHNVLGNDITDAVLWG